MDVNQLEKLMRNLVVKETRDISLDQLESQSEDVELDVYETMLRSSNLFQFLTDASNDQILVAERIIYDKALIVYPKGSPVIEEFIERCLTHPNKNVKQFGMRGASTLVSGSIDLSLNIIQLLIQHVVPMKEVFAKTLLDMLIKTLPAVFTDSGVQQNLQNVLEGDDIIRCRVYEIVCTILETRPDFLPVADTILKRALADMDKDDVLLQTTVLPILTQLLVTEEGFNYVESVDLFRKVYTNFVTVAVNPYIRFVLPNALKFYANAASVQPTLFLSRYPEAVDFIFDKAATGDPMLMAIAYDCLGIVAHTDEGKIHLSEQQKHKMDAFLKELPNTLHSTTDAFKVRFIESFTALLTPKSKPIDNRISSITQKWFVTMAEREDLEIVHELFKVPFPDIKMATLKLLSVILDYRWGQTFFQNTACFGETLLNRSLDVDVNVTQYKYDVIKKLSQSTTLDSFVSDSFTQYVSEGAFYRKANVEVVIEGGQ